MTDNATAENRQIERLPLTMHVQLIARGMHRRSCLMKDISQGGALLELREGGDKDDRQLARGDVVLLRMFLNNADQVTEQELRARVAHVSGHLFGIMFVNPDEKVMAKLLAFADTEKTEHSNELDEKGKWLLQDLQQYLLGYCQNGFPAFFQRTDEALLALSDKAHSNTDQRTYFEAATVLRRQHNMMRDAFLQFLNASFERGIARDKSQDPSNLALVDKDQFEDWLAIKVMASRAEAECRHQLYGLQVRLDELGHRVRGHQHNPVSPFPVCEAFQHAVITLKPDPLVEKTLYQIFEETILAGLNGAYEVMNRILVQNNVLPDLTMAHYAKQLEEPIRKLRESTTAAETKEEESGSVLPSSRSAGAASQIFAGEPSDASIGTQSAAGNNGEDIPAGRVGAASMARFQSSQRDAKAAVSSLKRLFETQRVMRESARRDEIVRQGGAIQENVAPVPTFEIQDFKNSFGELKAEQENWRGKLDAMASSQGAELAGAVVSIVQMTEGLLRTLSDNKLLSDHARDWFKRLELPVLHSLASEDDMFQRDDHPARQVLNRLARLGFKSHPLSKQQIGALDKLVDKIGQDFDQNPKVFQQALSVLDPFVAKQEQTYQRNLERVRQLAEGEQKLENAKQRVQEVLDERLAGKKVPQPVMTLLTAGWHDLLVKVYLRQGEISKDWKDYLGLIDEMLAIGADMHRAFDLRDILRLVKNGMQEVVDISGRDQQQAVKELKHLLAGPQRLLGDVAWVQVPAKKVEVADVEEERWLQKWMERASRLQLGDWMELRRRGEDPERLRLAWRNKEGSRFVFVNHQGVKVNDFTLRELAALMHTGNVLIFEGDDIPIVDDALEKVVHELYEKLAWQAMHDELTGLVNRAEFARQLERALELAKRKQVHHVLVHINIDQFKSINSMAGLDAGDRMLKDIAVLLNKPLTIKTVVARLHGDQFGILLEDCTLPKAQKLMSQRLTELQSMKFMEGEDQYRVTASAGMVDILYTSDNSGRILGEAEEACSQAKSEGGNRIQVYQPDSKEMQRRDSVAAWLSRLNQALEEENLTLRCQKIRPVNAQAMKSELPHYEILIGMRSDENAEVSPAEFVQAAERYNRMLAVDRWVVDNTFQWMRDHPEKLAEIGMLSINLSGHSLTEARIMSYIRERIQEHRLPGDKICFEITETAAISNLADAIELMRELRTIGCRFALDDFGVGHGAYHYLKHLPLDFVKIDGAFVRDLDEDDNDLVMVRSINDLAHYMGLKTIAEFVENQAVLTRLGEIGVDYAQGYAIGKPQWLDTL